MSQIIIAPQRVQRRRTKGWRAPLDQNGLPPIYCGRGTRWGNPFKCSDATIAVELFRDLAWKLEWVKGKPSQPGLNFWQSAGDIRERNLMCWCRLDAPCHCDVILEYLAFVQKQTDAIIIAKQVLAEPYQDGINRAALMFHFVVNRPDDETQRLFGLSYHELLEYKLRYRDVTIHKPKS